MEKVERPEKEHGITASNRDFIRYEGVNKPQNYLFAEAAKAKDGSSPAEEFDEEYEIKTLDCKLLLNGDVEQKQQFAQQLGEAMESIGFAILKNHGVAQELLDGAQARTRALFEKLSAERKEKDFGPERHGSINQGYFGIKKTTEIHPDLVEGWVFCREAFKVPQKNGAAPTADLGKFWPSEDDEAFFRQLVQQEERLILPLMQSALQYLKAPDVHVLDDALTHTNVAMRLNYYPPISAEDDKTGAGRLLGHEDVTVFTLLPAPRSEGLQVLNRKNFKWIRLTAPPDTIILNTGDYMQRLSNDIFPSTTHRVSKPANAPLKSESRVSFPLNVYLWEDHELRVFDHLPRPKYAPITALKFHTSITSKYYGDDYKVE